MFVRNLGNMGEEGNISRDPHQEANIRTGKTPDLL